jgi:Tol biopolymer transport system component
MAGTTQRKPHSQGWLAFFAALLALALPPGAEAAYPGANGRIAFSVEVWQPPPPPDPIPPEYPHPGLPIEPVLVSSRIVSVMPTGRRKRRLHTVPVGTGAYYGPAKPAFSPNGRLIAFDQDARLAIMRHDGAHMRMLPPMSDADFAPTWSPNGRRLAFLGQRPCPIYCGTLFTVRADGSGLRQVTDYEALWPAWSMRGRIAFLNNDDQYRFRVGPRDGLYSIRSDGSRLRRLFGTFLALGNEPDWSPDGRRLAFRARRRIVTMNADGSRRRAITERGRSFSHPAWSPDGRYIAAVGGDVATDDHALYVMRPNGRGLRRVVAARRATSSDGDVSEWETFGPPSWQPVRGSAQGRLLAAAEGGAVTPAPAPPGPR